MPLDSAKPRRETRTQRCIKVGVINGVRGVFRSNDSAESWTRINDDAHQWGLILQITGDPRIYGRVYVGTPRTRNRLWRSGRGTLTYGEHGEHGERHDKPRRTRQQCDTDRMNRIYRIKEERRANFIVI